MDGFFENDGVVVDSYNSASATLVTRLDEGLKGGSQNGAKSVFIRPSLRLEPNDKWTIDIIGEIWDDKGDGSANWSQCYEPGSQPAPVGNGPSGSTAVHTLFGFPCKDPFGDDRFGIPGDGSDPFEVSSNLSPDQTEQEIRGITIDTSYQLDSGTLTLVLNHREVEEDVSTDTDGFNWDLFSSARIQEFESTQV
jgi:hypothetical protein